MEITGDRVDDSNFWVDHLRLKSIWVVMVEQ
jgi:hypothetical protein